MVDLTNWCRKKRRKTDLCEEKSKERKTVKGSGKWERRKGRKERSQKEGRKRKEEKEELTNERRRRREMEDTTVEKKEEAPKKEKGKEEVPKKEEGKEGEKADPASKSFLVSKRKRGFDAKYFGNTIKGGFQKVSSSPLPIKIFFCCSLQEYFCSCGEQKNRSLQT